MRGVTAGSIVPVNRQTTKLVGVLLWRGAKWYVRRRLPSTRTVVSVALAGLSALVVVGLLARRLGG
jgi:hypothetical protein